MSGVERSDEAILLWIELRRLLHYFVARNDMANHLPYPINHVPQIMRIVTCLIISLRLYSGEAPYGTDHPSVARDVNNLGLVLQALGDHAGSKAAFERLENLREIPASKPLNY